MQRHLYYNNHYFYNYKNHNMKSISLLLVFITVFIQGLSAQVETILAGKISNPNGDSVWIRTYDFDRYNRITKHASSVVNTQGRFKMKLSLNEPLSAYFFDGNERTQIYLEPGDNLFLTIDTKEFDETIKYLGHGSENNNFLALFYLKFEDFQSIDEINQLWAPEPENYKPFRDSIYNAQNRLFENYKTLHKISEGFDEYMTAKIVYRRLDDMLDYPAVHKYNTEKDSLILPESYYCFLDTIDLNKDKLLILSEYRVFVYDYLTCYLYQREKDGQSDLFKHPFYLYLQKKLEGKTEYYMRAQYIFDQMWDMGCSNIKELYYNFIKENPYEEYNQILIKAWAKRQKLEPGNKAPSFRLKNLDGEEISLNDFLGKVVFIDFWSTGCGPCIKNFPYINKVKKHFADRDVVFIYMSVINNPESIKEKIEKHNLDGIHLISDAVTRSKYHVGGIPAYFLIDKEGKMATAPPHPGETEALITAIEELLLKE